MTEQAGDLLYDSKCITCYNQITGTATASARARVPIHGAMVRASFAPVYECSMNTSPVRGLSYSVVAHIAAIRITKALHNVKKRDVRL